MPLPFFPPTRRNRLVPEQNPRRMSNMRSDPHRLLKELSAPNLPTDALRNKIPAKTSQWGSSGRIPDLYRATVSVHPRSYLYAGPRALRQI
jgi:hypothetical protein